MLCFAVRKADIFKGGRPDVFARVKGLGWIRISDACGKRSKGIYMTPCKAPPGQAWVPEQTEANRTGSSRAAGRQAQPHSAGKGLLITERLHSEGNNGHLNASTHISSGSSYVSDG